MLVVKKLGIKLGLECCYLLPKILDTKTSSLELVNTYGHINLCQLSENLAGKLSG